MKVTPFDTYQHYLSLKNHFTNPKYDSSDMVRRPVQVSLHSIKEEISIGSRKTSRKYNDEEVVKFLVSNFAYADNPQNLWIGEIISSGERTYARLDKETTEFDLLVQRTKQRITLEQRIRESIQLLERSSNNLKKISWWRHKS